MVALSNFVFDGAVALFHRFKILIGYVGMSVGTGGASVALPSYKERTNMRLIPGLLFSRLTVVLQGNLS